MRVIGAGGGEGYSEVAAFCRQLTWLHLQDEGEPIVLNDEEDLKRQQAAARNVERLEREREA